ncbi:hypothetical protein HDU98_000213 [Podochytrium sp. JEL0797]|nr:hypothetical protein HDU98_000213 [Podochytrium sp. JEL0797]
MATTTSTLSPADISARQRHLKKLGMLTTLTNPRPSLRPLRAIVDSDAFVVEKFRGGECFGGKKNGGLEKKKLQRFMESDGGKNELGEEEEGVGEYGDFVIVDGLGGNEVGSKYLNQKPAVRIGFGRRKGCKAGIKGVAKAAEEDGMRARDEEIDEFEMVFKEIEERKQWLDDMIGLGRGDMYRKQIQGEIASRIKRLEEIDREKGVK